LGFIIASLDYELVTTTSLIYSNKVSPVFSPAAIAKSKPMDFHRLRLFPNQKKPSRRVPRGPPAKKTQMSYDQNWKTKLRFDKTLKNKSLVFFLTLQKTLSFF
jgi:hypothetical protein